MLFFLDESFQTVGGRSVGALGAVGIPEDSYNRFCGIMHSVKKSVFGTLEITDHEMKGNGCFSKAVFRVHEDPVNGPAKWFEVSDRLFDALGEVGGTVFALWTEAPELLSLRNTDRDQLTGPYVAMLHDFCRAMSMRPELERGHLYFDQLGHAEDKHAAAVIANHMARTTDRFALQRRIIQVPHYTHSAVSPGLQMADVVAYLAANRADPSDRPELTPWWNRLDQFASIEVARRRRKGSDTRRTAGAYVEAPRRLRWA